MSQVARVFVVLNLLLAAGFFFASATFLGTKDSYKQKFEAEQKQRNDDNERNKVTIASKDAMISTLDNEKRSLSEQRGTLEGTVTGQKNTITTLDGTVKEKDTQIAALTTTNNGHASNIQAIQAQNSELMTQNAALAAQRNEAVKNMETAQTELTKEQQKNVEARNTIADLEKNLKTAGDDIAHKGLMIEYARQKGIDFEGLQVLPPLSGAVVNADNNLKLVQANIGSTNGVKRGAVLDIVRGGQYIGRFRVDTVFDSYCAGLVTVLNPGQMVQVGDRVTNTLN